MWVRRRANAVSWAVQVQISTVEPFWKCTKEILHRLAAAKA